MSAQNADDDVTGRAEPAPMASSIFRDEALRYYGNPGDQHGALLQITPSWSGQAYWLLLASVLLASAYVVFGTVHEYAVGPALTRVEGRVQVTMPEAGTISSIEVRPGQRVHAGDVLVRLYVAEELAELARLQAEYDLQVAKTLHEPSDEAARRGLIALSTARARAQGRVQNRTIRAPSDGTVGDFRIRPGQHLSAGDVLFGLAGMATTWSVIALLPGQYRPVVQRGAVLKLAMHGYRYVHRDLRVDAVSDELVGPEEVRRYLGREIADSVVVSGPLMLVHARLPSRTFEQDGQVYHHYDGMSGTAEVRAGSERILFVLLPALRRMWASLHG